MSLDTYQKLLSQLPANTSKTQLSVDSEDYSRSSQLFHQKKLTGLFADNYDKVPEQTQQEKYEAFMRSMEKLRNMIEPKKVGAETTQNIEKTPTQFKKFK